MLGEGKALRLSGRPPGDVDAATKAALLDLLDVAVEAGWSWRNACRVSPSSVRKFP